MNTAFYFTIFVQDFNIETGGTPANNYFSWWWPSQNMSNEYLSILSKYRGKGKHAIKIKEHKLPRYHDKSRYSLYVTMYQCCLCKRQGFLSWKTISKGNTCSKLGPRIYSCILKYQHMCTLVLGCYPCRIWEYKENISRQMCMYHEILFCT